MLLKWKWSDTGSGEYSCTEIIMTTHKSWLAIGIEEFMSNDPHTGAVGDEVAVHLVIVEQMIK